MKIKKRNKLISNQVTKVKNSLVTSGTILTIKGVHILKGLVLMGASALLT